MSLSLVSISTNHHQNIIEAEPTIARLFHSFKGQPPTNLKNIILQFK